jgi:diaminopimelate decarboxylase
MLEKLKYIDNELFFDEVNLNEVVRNFDTPTYIYSKSRIIENYDAYCNNFKKNNISNYLICYAIKANENLSILKILANLGSGADTVSANEIKKSIMAGILPHKIVYSGVGKSDEELEYAIMQQIGQINIESKEEFENIQRIAKKLNMIANISIRINPDIDACTHEKITTGKKENKFGVDIKIAELILLEAKKDNLMNVKGLSIHIGSQILDANKFELAFEYLANIYKQHKEFTTVDLGGGLGIQYKEDEQTPSHNTFTELVQKYFGKLNVEVIIEPGRSIIGDACIFLTKVLYVKETETKKFVVVNGGMNNLIRPAMYGAYHHPLVVNIKSQDKETYDIVGPICESGDTFVKGLHMNKVERGNFIAFLSAGAYGRSMSSNYNLHNISGELLIENRKVKQIRKPISFEDLVKFEKI